MSSIFQNQTFRGLEKQRKLCQGAILVSDKIRLEPRTAWIAGMFPLPVLVAGQILGGNAGCVLSPATNPPLPSTQGTCLHRTHLSLGEGAEFPHPAPESVVALL